MGAPARQNWLTMTETCLIDTLGPLAVVQPQDIAELSNAVCAAAGRDEAIYPIGGKTMLAYGLPPIKPGIAVDTGRLDRVIDYPARDMTVTVQAGITLAKLQAVLGKENQRLPIDVPLAERATLGGVLATNASGPRRYGFGTARDYVIGISVMNDQGEEAKAGGRVVKNVAGYDLCKLYIGSLGTLGIITQVTLKLKPRPEEQALLTLPCSDAALEAVLDRLHGSRTRPICLDLLNRATVQYINQQIDNALPDSPWVVAIGFEDNRPAVEWQVQEVTRELADAGWSGIHLRQTSSAESLWRALVEFPAWPGGRLTFKTNLPPHACAAFCRQAAASYEPLLLQAHAGNGIVIGQSDDHLTFEAAKVLMGTLQAAASNVHGNLVILRCPAEWKAVLPVWGCPRQDGWLMHAVKQRLDPGRLFNPGRFVDGI